MIYTHRLIYAVNKISRKAGEGSLPKHGPTVDMWSYGSGTLPDVIKLACWNVNGLRSVINKGALQAVLKQLNPDIVCFNETKMDMKAYQKEKLEFDYHQYWNFCKVSSGYSGVAIFSKYQPIRAYEDFQYIEKEPNSVDSLEGRILTLEFEKMFLTTVYKPNSGQHLQRLDLRVNYVDKFVKLIQALSNKKPIVVCGDMNVAHQPMDLARPLDNLNNAGFTIQQRDSFSKLLQCGLVDCYRQENPLSIQYTWWSNRAQSRARNIGWRIDYFLASKQINYKGPAIHDQMMGSDHCPISLEINTRSLGQTNGKTDKL